MEEEGEEEGEGGLTRSRPLQEARRKVFPFSRLAGQPELKLALLLNVVDPKIGGVLAMGDRGTGKSVAVRALVELLPTIDVVEGDAFNSDPEDTRLMGPEALAAKRAGQKLASRPMRTPLIELPLGATEDRVCGTIDIEAALQEGKRAYEPGLLAKANRGILYVDEVNLLDDSLVDVVLDSAASGLNTVEREGVSVSHPAKYILVGSGNPAEGEMRPQLLDRFGCSVEIKTLDDADERLAMVLDRMDFDADPDAFLAKVEPEQEEVRQQILAARAQLPRVTVARDIKLKVAEVCSALGIEGLRGDIVVDRVAKALVAWEGREEVTEEDVGRIIGMCLGHRMRKDPLDPIDGGFKVLVAFKRVFNDEDWEPPAPEGAAPAEAAEAAGVETEGERTGLKPGQWRGP